MNPQPLYCHIILRPAQPIIQNSTISAFLVYVTKSLLREAEKIRATHAMEKKKGNNNRTNKRKRRLHIPKLNVQAFAKIDVSISSVLPNGTTLFYINKIEYDSGAVLPRNEEAPKLNRLRPILMKPNKDEE